MEYGSGLSEDEFLDQLQNQAEGLNPDGSTPDGDEDEDEDCCPECGHPKDGSSGHGTCDHQCHAAA